MRTAVFPGSFDPFTIGHKSIVDRGCRIFDRVIVAIGVNGNKNCRQSVEERIEEIQTVFRDNPAVKVAAYSGLTVDFARERGAEFILRGVRGVRDFEYERDMAEVNSAISDIETVFLCADSGKGFISSSVVRELEHFGYDASRFVAQREGDRNSSKR